MMLLLFFLWKARKFTFTALPDPQFIIMFNSEKILVMNIICLYARNNGGTVRICHIPAWLRV